MNIKKIICLILCASIFLLSSNIILAEEKTAKPKIEETNISLKVNGKIIDFPDQKPFVMDDRTYVPVRFLAEALGADVSWNEEKEVIKIANKGIQDVNSGDIFASYYYLKLGYNQLVWAREAKDYYMHSEGIVDQAISFDMPNYPILANDRTMLPFRFIAEILGAFVYYDNNTNTAYLESTSFKGNGHIYPYPVMSSLLSPYVLEALNTFRASNNRKPVKLDGSLVDAATWKSRHMSLNNYFDHSNQDGTTSAGRFFSLYQVNDKITIPLGEDLSTAAFNFDNIDLILDDIDSELSLKTGKENTELYYNLKDIWGINLPNPTTPCPFNDCLGNKFEAKHKINILVYSKDAYDYCIQHPEHISYSGEPWRMVSHVNEDMYRKFAEGSIATWSSSPSHKSVMLSPYYQSMGYGAAQMPNGMYSTYQTLVMRQSY